MKKVFGKFEVLKNDGEGNIPWDEIVKTPGVYTPYRNSTYRLVVIGKDAVLCVQNEGTVLGSADDGWKGMRFLKLNESFTLTVQ